jgi:hypothetical protein
MAFRGVDFQFAVRGVKILCSDSKKLSLERSTHSRRNEIGEGKRLEINGLNFELRR